MCCIYSHYEIERGYCCYNPQCCLFRFIFTLAQFSSSRGAHIYRERERERERARERETLHSQFKRRPCVWMCHGVVDRETRQTKRVLSRQAFVSTGLCTDRATEEEIRHAALRLSPQHPVAREHEQMTHIGPVWVGIGQGLG